MRGRGGGRRDCPGGRRYSCWRGRLSPPRCRAPPGGGRVRRQAVRAPRGVPGREVRLLLVRRHVGDGRCVTLWSSRSALRRLRPRLRRARAMRPGHLLPPGAGQRRRGVRLPELVAGRVRRALRRPAGRPAALRRLRPRLPGPRMVLRWAVLRPEQLQRGRDVRLLPGHHRLRRRVRRPAAQRTALRRLRQPVPRGRALPRRRRARRSPLLPAGRDRLRRPLRRLRLALRVRRRRLPVHPTGMRRPVREPRPEPAPLRRLRPRLQGRRAVLLRPLLPAVPRVVRARRPLRLPPVRARLRPGELPLRAVRPRAPEGVGPTPILAADLDGCSSDRGAPSVCPWRDGAGSSGGDQMGERRFDAWTQRAAVRDAGGEQRWRPPDQARPGHGGGRMRPGGQAGRRRQPLRRRRDLPAAAGAREGDRLFRRELGQRQRRRAVHQLVRRGRWRNRTVYAAD